jgi:hypothetical protein
VDIKSDHPSSALSAPPSPLFITKMQKQPGSPTSKGLTPPRSPSGEKYGLGRTFSPMQSSNLLEQFRVNPAASIAEDRKSLTSEGDPYNTKFSKTDTEAIKKIASGGSLSFGDLVSNDPGFQAPSPTDELELEKKQSSPRSPVGRTDKRSKD